MPALGREPPVRLPKPMTATGRTADGSHSVAYSLNVGNLRDTGHSAEATPQAALAEDLPVSSRLERLLDIWNQSLNGRGDD